VAAHRVRARRPAHREQPLLSLRHRAALRELAIAGNTSTLAALSRARVLTASMAALGLLTLALVFTMVVKPSLF
jgi:hypothetical protein